MIVCLRAASPLRWNLFYDRSFDFRDFARYMAGVRSIRLQRMDWVSPGVGRPCTLGQCFLSMSYFSWAGPGRWHSPHAPFWSQHPEECSRRDSEHPRRALYLFQQSRGDSFDPDTAEWGSLRGGIQAHKPHKAKGEAGGPVLSCVCVHTCGSFFMCGLSLSFLIRRRQPVEATELCLLSESPTPGSQ